MENEWIGLPDNYTDYHSIVYIINSKIDDKYYVGVKKLLKRVKRKPLKNKKRGKVVYKDNGLLTYYGSSKNLLEDIAKNGKESYTRTVLHLCQSQSESKYLELCEQVARNVLFDKNSYNSIVNLRVGRFKSDFKFDFDSFYKKVKSVS